MVKGSIIWRSREGEDTILASGGEVFCVFQSALLFSSFTIKNKVVFQWF